jgi:hypothetical protein
MARPTPTTTGPNAVKVVAALAAGSPNGPLPLFFGPAYQGDFYRILRALGNPGRSGRAA